MAKVGETKWLLFIHQIPPKPDYFRVKIWRRLQRIGAVAIKQSVYVLPKNEQAYEDLNWILREISGGGGEAYLCGASFLEGMTNEQVEALFRAARDSDYKKIVKDARPLANTVSQEARISGERLREMKNQLFRLKRRYAAVVAIDFFEASSREAAEGRLAGIESALTGEGPETLRARGSFQDARDRTWVTRKGIYVDRIACAWLIKRFVDPDARFKFVTSKVYRPKPDELRFDMFEGEFTHEGDRCTFEVLMEQFHLPDPALGRIAEIIHDIDLKDGKFDRDEVAGIAALFSGISMAYEQDEERLARGSMILDELYECFSRQRKENVL
ncbi:MAG: chromate resistance protein [Deltaproteobacteria bacterium]|nr:chromate resistance protein [Deltaproteobacteria bacterium]